MTRLIRMAVGAVLAVLMALLLVLIFAGAIIWAVIAGVFRWIADSARCAP